MDQWRAYCFSHGLPEAGPVPPLPPGGGRAGQPADGPTPPQPATAPPISDAELAARVATYVPEGHFGCSWQSIPNSAGLVWGLHVRADVPLDSPIIRPVPPGAVVRQAGPTLALP